MIVTGDPSQVDLPPGQTSGLAEATHLLRNVEGIGHVVYTAEDVVRHELVARIVDAYDKASALKAAKAHESWAQEDKAREGKAQEGKARESKARESKE
jgi:phosphate starvation-inducible protein PhoH and related proteins